MMLSRELRNTYLAMKRLRLFHLKQVGHLISRIVMRPAEDQAGSSSGLAKKLEDYS